MAESSGEELVDVIDEAGRYVTTVTRRAMRAGRLRHRSVFVIVTSPDGRLLVHRRSDGKDVWPGRWDLAAGGVLGPGESVVDAAVRELAEELGIAVAIADLTFLGEHSYRDDDVDELSSVFHLVHDGPFRFVDGEVAEARFVTRTELDHLRASAPFVPDSLAIVPVTELLH